MAGEEGKMFVGGLSKTTAQRKFFFIILKPIQIIYFYLLQSQCLIILAVSER